jgi:hypothetical protein
LAQSAADRAPDVGDDEDEEDRDGELIIESEIVL